MLETCIVPPNKEPAEPEDSYSSLARRMIESLKGSHYARLIWRGSLAVAFGYWLAGDQVTSLAPVGISADTIQSGFLAEPVELDPSEFAVLLREANIRQFGYTEVGRGRVDDGVYAGVFRRQFQHWTEFVLVLTSPSYPLSNPHNTYRRSFDIYGNPDPNAFELFPQLQNEETPEMIVLRMSGSSASSVQFSNMSFADDGSTFTLFFETNTGQQAVTMSRSHYGTAHSKKGWQLVTGPSGTRASATSYQEFEQKLWRSR